MAKRKRQLDFAMAERKRQATMDAFFVKREPAPPKRASFFGLPGEIRNEIYSYIMDDVYEQMEDEDGEALRITSYCFEQPSVCLVSKQLRYETLGLFFGSARFPMHFEIVIQDLKSGPQRGHFAWSRRHGVTLEGDYSWSNFKEWLHRYWARPKITILSAQDNFYGELLDLDVLYAAFKMVNKLADAGTKWEVVSDVLETYREGTEFAGTEYGRSPFWE